MRCTINAEPLYLAIIRLAAPRVTGYAVLSWTINRLIDVAYDGNTDETMARLRLLVPEFSRAEHGKVGKAANS